MREQAALLGEKTQNLIEAMVDTTAFGRDFVHSFVLNVPVLGGYRYTLFEVTHGPELYPVTVVPAKSVVLEDEPAFLEWLRGVLSSPETKKLIGNLLAQATS
jgi:hypothetical protein